MPRWLAPLSHAFEASADGRFRFHVEISHPLTGLMVKYQRWLAPCATARRKAGQVLPTV
jgi:hypothetical protein